MTTESTLSFADLELHDRLCLALEQAKIHKPTEVQTKVIPVALEGKDLQISSETGSGKTLAYLLPLMDRLAEKPKHNQGSRALILLPTRELAQQTFKHCQRLAEYIKLKSVLVIGGQESRYQASLLRRDPEIIVATPGRLIEHLNKGSALLDQIECLVLDEADRMLDMGFREDVLDIVERTNPERQSILLSATMNHKGVSFVAKQVLQNPIVFNIANAQTKHEHITQKILLSDDAEHKKKQLAWLLSKEPFDKALVFANKRAHVTELYQWLRTQKIRSNEIHGEILQDERKQVMSQFAQGRFNVLVATDVAARGLDISGVDLVINFDMAHSGDEYVHRIGRTGRAGNDGTAVSLIAAYEWNLAASIQRYLKQSFEPFIVPGLEGKYKGPKKVKSSGQAAGKKNKKTKDSANKKLSKKKKSSIADKKAKKSNSSSENEPKQRHRDKKNIGKRRHPKAEKLDADITSGLAPPKKQR